MSFGKILIPVFLGLALWVAPVSSINLVGDADNNGTVNMIDAALAQARLLGIIDEWSISPLALADGDSDLDLTDLLLLGQAANGLRTLQGPGGWLTYTQPSNITTESGAAPLTLFWGVYSTFVGVASNTDGMEAAIIKIPDTAESLVGDYAPLVAGLVAETTLQPVNTSPTQQFVTLRLDLAICDSTGGTTLTTDSNFATILVGPPVCGNAWVQPGEVCDDGGDNGNYWGYCSTACDRILACGDGIVDLMTLWDEECDDGDTSDDCVCLGDCRLPNCGDFLICGGESCDDGSSGSMTCDGDCTEASCGDGYVNGNFEQCDDSGETAVCDIDCSWAWCGDGYVNGVAGEECDAPDFNMIEAFTDTTFPYLLDAFIDEGKAYLLGSGYGLAVMDISGPSPVSLYTYTLDDPTSGLHVAGDRVYVANGSYGLTVINVSGPAPVFAGSYDTVGNANDVFVSGDRAYVADGNGLVVLDIAGPVPLFLGSYDTPGYANSVFVTDGRAFVVDGNNGLVVLDVTGPVPSLLGSYDTLGYSRNVFVVGNRAFVADGNSGLVVLDVSGPVPLLLGNYNTSGSAYEVFVSGNQAYVADDNYGMSVFDVTGPTPDLRGIFYTGNTWSVFGVGNRAYFTDYDDGFIAVDIVETCRPGCVAPFCGDGIKDAGEECDDGNAEQDDDCLTGCVANVCGDGIIDFQWPDVEECDDAGESPTCDADCTAVACGDRNWNPSAGEECDVDPVFLASLGATATVGDARGVFVKGDIAYVATDSGLERFNVSSEPPLFLDATGIWNARDVFVKDNFAYVAANDGLTVWEISGSTIEYSGEYGFDFEGVFVSGNRAFVADGFDGLVVLDASGPTPVLLGSYDTSGYSYDVFIKGNRAYVADGYNGLVVLDVSGPIPVFLGSYDTAGNANDVFVSDNLAYVADSNNGLVVLDVTAPVPTFLGSYNTLGSAEYVFVAGNRAYVAGWGNGLVALDVSGPIPSILGLHEQNNTRGIFVFGNRAYVADTGNGLAVLDIREGCAQDCTLPICGDGAVNPGEECDDANGSFGDDCTPGCIRNLCGDGIQNTTGWSSEQCEDGGMADGDGCDANCLIEVCGNGADQIGEDCDVFSHDPTWVSNMLGYGSGFLTGDVFVRDGKAYLAYGDLHVLDVTVSPPVYLTTYVTPGGAGGVFVTADRAYVADGSNGLVVLDVTGPSPVFLGNYVTSWSASDVFVSGNRAYVAIGSDGLAVLDVTGPVPVFLGSYDTGVAEGVFVSGTRAYVADSNFGLVVLDVTGPVPTFLGSYATSYAYDVYISGNRAYVADLINGLVVLDVTGPVPVFLGSYNTPGSANGVFVSGNRAYVSDNNGLVVLDVTSPVPSFVGSYNMPTNSAYYVFVWGDRAYTNNAILDIGETCHLDCTTDFCGDGIVNPGEECDDGNALFNDDCLPTCILATCGDGIINSDGLAVENCDDGASNGAGPGFCLSNCSAVE